MAQEKSRASGLSPDWVIVDHSWRKAPSSDSASVGFEVKPTAASRRFSEIRTSEPGTATGYHALTYGWIVGGIVQGASGRHIKDVIREEIAEPLGVGDEMFVGIPDGLDDRLASLQANELSEGLPLAEDHDFFKAMPRENDFTFNDMAVRKACLPAANGHFTARALARMYGALANGGEIDGVRLVSPERIPEMQRVLTDMPDRVLLGMPIPKGVGFMMGGDWAGMPAVSGPRRTAFGHSGAGGSTAFADPEAGEPFAAAAAQAGMKPVAAGVDRAGVQLADEPEPS